MNWSNKSLSFLDLSTTEVKILNALHVAKSHQEVAKDIGIPRTTVAFITKNLIEKGLVLSVRNGKRFRYVSLTEEQLTVKIEQMLSAMKLTASERKGAQIRLSKESQFTIHVGLSEVITAYSRIASANKSTRIKAIQSNKSWNTIVAKLAPEQLIQFNKSVIDNDLIIDGILQDNYYDQYAEYLRKHPQEISTDTAKSLTGRMADYTLVPKQYFDVYSEIWIFNTTVIIINWHEEVAIEIINPEMMSFLRDMFEFVKLGGKKVNHEEAMRKVLESVQT
jgi:DNA-binding MarR family transcriptional regulator